MSPGQRGDAMCERVNYSENWRRGEREREAVAGGALINCVIAERAHIYSMRARVCVGACNTRGRLTVYICWRDGDGAPSTLDRSAESLIILLSGNETKSLNMRPRLAASMDRRSRSLLLLFSSKFSLLPRNRGFSQNDRLNICCFNAYVVWIN